MKQFFYIAVCLFFFGCQKESELPETFLLHDNWQFKASDKEDWLSAKVSGNVYADLLENKQIPNPFLGDNETEVQ